MEEINVFLKQFCGRINEMTPEEIKAHDEENAFLTDCVEKIKDLEAQLDSFIKDQQPPTT